MKKTTKQKTNPFRPCDRGGAAHTSARVAPSHATTSTKPPPAADEMHAGIRLLLQIGASRPDLLLTGHALTDRGRVATVMLEAGWNAEQLRHVITGRPLPNPVRTSIGAIIAARCPRPSPTGPSWSAPAAACPPLLLVKTSARPAWAGRCAAPAPARRLSEHTRRRRPLHHVHPPHRPVPRKGATHERAH
ncbi:hypothetical protein AB0N17_42670 [Streptomyces sp. NPDC051133]|uniref:hypothetical protein n=1 Tax=Streptomyces sp. NPDC051133 TaxID=3155521 RepID=UPI003417A53B